MAQEGQIAYVVEERFGPDNSAVVFVDVESNRVVDTLELGTNAEFIFLSPDETLLVVTDESRRLQIFDTSTRLNVRSTEEIARPLRVAFAPDGARAYVTSVNPSQVSVVDIPSLDVVSTIPISDEPGLSGGIGIVPDGRFAYVTPIGVFDDSFILVIDLATEQIVRRIAMPPCGFGLSYDLAIRPDGARVYVPVFGCTSPSGTGAGSGETCPGDCDGSGQVEVGDLITGVGVALGRLPASSCEAADANRNGSIGVDELVAAVDLSLSGCGTPPAEGDFALVVDTGRNRIFRVIEFGAIGPGNREARSGAGQGGVTGGSGVDVTPDGRFVYVSSCTSGGVCVIDTETNEIVDVVDVGGLLFDLDVSPDGRFAYTTDLGTEGSLVAIDIARNEVVGRIALEFPGGVVVGRTPAP
jgi:YVTN family beta-propeller protein